MSGSAGSFPLSLQELRRFTVSTGRSSRCAVTNRHESERLRTCARARASSLGEQQYLVTGELKSQVDKVWNAFWSGGIANPMEVIEQITYLLFIKRLDELHTLAENKANTLGKPIENPVFPEGIDDSGRRPRPFSDLRWSQTIAYCT